MSGKGRGAAPFRFDAESLSPQAPPEAVTPVPAAAPTRQKAPRPPSRQGKRNVNFVLSEHAWEQLSILSVRTRRPIQDLMVEATDLLFQTHGLSRVARD